MSTMFEHDAGDGGETRIAESRPRESTPGESLQERLDREYDSYGGLKPGAAFFGWLSANGLVVLLVAVASTVGAALGLATSAEQQARENPETVGVVGAALLVVILALGYFAGGYVAGRMARFDGGRQGFAVWVIGLVVTGLLGAAGFTFGRSYDGLNSLDLPSLPVREGQATTGGLVALGVVVLLTLVMAVVGGRTGERYHRKVDDAGDDFWPQGHRRTPGA